MRGAIIIFLFLSWSCGGSLSSEQRKKIRENMDAKSIKKISDAELTESAFAYGRVLTKIIEAKNNGLANGKFLDSLGRSFGVQILSLQPADPYLRGVEKKIIEAYISGGNLSNIGDNIQKMGPDSLLYTKPIVSERPDGSVEFNKALAIRIPKKKLILSIKE